jgi:hypothetical protein
MYRFVWLLLSAPGVVYASSLDAAAQALFGVTFAVVWGSGSGACLSMAFLPRMEWKPALFRLALGWFAGIALESLFVWHFALVKAPEWGLSFVFGMIAIPIIQGAMAVAARAPGDVWERVTAAFTKGSQS